MGAEAMTLALTTQWDGVGGSKSACLLLPDRSPTSLRATAGSRDGVL
jgi:hypothetical protein